MSDPTPEPATDDEAEYEKREADLKARITKQEHVVYAALLAYQGEFRTLEQLRRELMWLPARGSGGTE